MDRPSLDLELDRTGLFWRDIDFYHTDCELVTNDPFGTNLDLNESELIELNYFGQIWTYTKY